MKHLHEIRAEDFRKAWPNAFHQAILQVVELQDSLENLQARMASIGTNITISIERAATKMTAMHDENISELSRAAQLGSNLLFDNIEIQRVEFKRLIKQQEKFKEMVATERNEIQRMKREYQKRYEDLRRSNLIKRLLWALRPD